MCRSLNAIPFFETRGIGSGTSTSSDTQRLHQISKWEKIGVESITPSLSAEGFGAELDIESWVRRRRSTKEVEDARNGTDSVQDTRNIKVSIPLARRLLSYLDPRSCNDDRTLRRMFRDLPKRSNKLPYTQYR